LSSQPRISSAPKVTVASAEHRGAYGSIGATMKELTDWLDSRGIQRSGDPFCMFYDNPTETPEQELRSEACVPVSSSFTPEGRFRLKELPQVEVAETRHTGPPEQFAVTYGPFLEGLLKGGYRLLGPAREYFRSPSDVRGPGSGYLIQQPVAKR
jgi:AraC family transcriptional regulator